MLWLIPIFAYATLSTILFYYPHIRHKRKSFKSFLLKRAQGSKKDFVIHISNRGGAREALENSVDAFLHSMEVGTNIIKTDLQLTKDKIIVLAHDINLNRLCGVDGELNKKNYKDLPRLATRIPIDFTVNSVHERGIDSQNYFSTLEEVFLRLPQAFFMLDLKNCSEALADEVNKLIAVHERDTLTIWGDTQGGVNLKNINPNIPTFFPDFTCFLIFFAFITGLLPLLPLKHEVFTWPLSTEDLQYVADRISPIKMILIRLFSLISRPVFRHLQRRGILVFLWGANGEKQFRRGVEKGANGIITDSPATLKKYLDKSGLYQDV